MSPASLLGGDTGPRMNPRHGVSHAASASQTLTKEAQGPNGPDRGPTSPTISGTGYPSAATESPLGILPLGFPLRAAPGKCQLLFGAVT